MAMKPEFLEILAGAGAAAITHIGLLDGDGVEISGGDPAYARQAVSWEEDELEAGIMQPESDLTFNVPAGSTVVRWHGFSAATGGTGYGGAYVRTAGNKEDGIEYEEQGYFLLQASLTRVRLEAAEEEGGSEGGGGNGE